jgi:hypothetical protein
MPRRVRTVTGGRPDSVEFETVLQIGRRGTHCVVVSGFPLAVDLANAQALLEEHCGPLQHFQQFKLIPGKGTCKNLAFSVQASRCELVWAQTMSPPPPTSKRSSLASVRSWPRAYFRPPTSRFASQPRCATAAHLRRPRGVPRQTWPR